MAATSVRAGVSKMSIDATYPQVALLVNLFGDLAFTYTQTSRWTSRMVGRRVETIDDLTVSEADAVIKALKAMKSLKVVA
jgi:hypothetical protein